MGNKSWHPSADQSVWMWYGAREFSQVFQSKSSKVLPDGVCMTGRVKGLSSTGGGGGGAKGGGGVAKGRKGKCVCVMSTI